jgi:hypothetical protein
MNSPFPKFDLVLQGECSRYTLKILKKYRKLDFVNRIILSTYESPFCERVKDDVEIVFNEMITPRGTGNRNLQINTSRNGLNRVKSEFCAKMRTDQLIRLPSMELMYDYWKKRHEDGKLFVLGMFRAFPYHPRDHVFWGRTEDVKNLFDVPFDQEPSPEHDYRYKTRAETYIGQFYYARFDPSIEEHIRNPLEFTVDMAPKLGEALEKDFRIRDKIFAPFPRISMAWPKHGLREYHYHIGEQHTEYWGEDD